MRDRLIGLPIDDAILILKEEHKQRVDGYATHLSYGGKGDPAEEVSLDALEMAISALEQTKWISVKDRLPETNYSVCVVACVDGNKSCVRLFERVTVRGKLVERFKYPWDTITDENITHWMPLPQPPKGE